MAIVALVGNVIASAFCCAPAPASKTVIVDAVLGALPLCAEASGNTGDSGKDPAGSKQHCPVCLSHASKAFLAAAALLAPSSLMPAPALAARADRQDVQERLRLGGLGSRAPPLPA